MRSVIYFDFLWRVHYSYYRRWEARGAVRFAQMKKVKIENQDSAKDSCDFRPCCKLSRAHPWDSQEALYRRGAVERERAQWRTRKVSHMLSNLDDSNDRAECGVEDERRRDLDANKLHCPSPISQTWFESEPLLCNLRTAFRRTWQGISPRLQR